MSQAAFKRRAAFPAPSRTPSSRPVARGASALLLVVLGACGVATPTDPTALPSAPPGELRALTGATSTPIFSTAAAGDRQARGDARGLNASGQITGAQFGLTSVGDFKPYRWTPGSGAEMLIGCCGTEWGADINDAGVVVGTAQQSLAIGARGFVAIGSSTQLLPILPGADPDVDASAVAINDAGLIVGSSPSGNLGSARHAVLWTAPSAIHDLGTLGGTNSAAIDINGAGQVIGSSQIAGDAVTHYFLWTAATGMQDLNVSVNANITSVVEINGAGQITGTYTTAGGQSHAFLYTQGSGLRDLGTLGGSTSAPTGLNDAGQVVGSSTTASGSTHAFLWTPTDGMADITAISGITSVGRLNDKLQTVSGYVAPSASVDLATAGIPRLVQLDVASTR
jgi:probable HAF family extracellular repeat protein